MAKIKTLSDKDIDLLTEMARAFRNGRGNPPSRPGSLSAQEGDDSMAPEVYIALTPSDGIPAVQEGSSSGTGTSLVTDTIPEIGDVPGSALCQVYAIRETGLSPVPGLTKRVYNLTDSVIPFGWIIILRDKFGKWLPTTSVGGSSNGPILGTAQAITYAGSTVTVISGIYSVTAYVRQGLVFNAGVRDYTLQNIPVLNSGSVYDYEIMNPDLEFTGLTTVAVDKDALADVLIYYPDAVTSTGLYKEVTCRYAGVSAGSRVRCRWMYGTTWEVVNAECTVIGAGTGTGTGT